MSLNKRLEYCGDAAMLQTRLEPRSAL